jgi:hypothetical protein
LRCEFYIWIINNLLQRREHKQPEIFSLLGGLYYLYITPFLTNYNFDKV